MNREVESGSRGEVNGQNRPRIGTAKCFVCISSVVDHGWWMAPVPAEKNVIRLVVGRKRSEFRDSPRFRAYLKLVRMYGPQHLYI